jgi:hypothetical protein
MTQASVTRPVTVNKLASAFGVKNFQVVHHFMEMNFFVTPSQAIEDEQDRALARELNYHLVIKDEDGGDSPSPGTKNPDSNPWSPVNRFR